MKKFYFIFLMFLLGMILVNAHECGDSGGLCLVPQEPCPSGYKESTMSCAPAIAPRCCEPINAVQESECEKAGYKCQSSDCNTQTQERVDLDCPIPEERFLVCCKDKVYANIAQEITITPGVAEEGDRISVSVNIPSFRDCIYFMTNPKGIKAEMGSGGCGPTGEAISFSTIRINELFGSIEAGTYIIEIKAEKTDNPDIILTKDFIIKPSTPYLKGDCEIQNGEGNCNFLGKSYQIYSKGCHDNVELVVSINGGEKKKFENLIQGVSEIKVDNIFIKLISAPCGAYVTKLQFKEMISNICGNNICEVDEDMNNCPGDCKQKLPELTEEDIFPELQCSVGCIYKTQCVSIGIRSEDKYCSLEGEFINQKDSGAYCENNFECISNVCVDNNCVEQGLFKRFIIWFKRLFG